MGGGYQGPSAAQLEAQAQRDFDRQKKLMAEQSRLAEEERQRQDAAAKEKAQADAARKEEMDANRKRAEELAANEASARAADVQYDPNSGSVFSFLRGGIQIPEGDGSSDGSSQ